MAEDDSTTRKRIIDAFLDMLEEKPLEKIRVTELTERAGIARSTFYTHFDSVYDILENLEHELLDAFPVNRYFSSKTTETQEGAQTAQIRAACRFVQHNARTLRALCGPNGDPTFQARMLARNEQVMQRLFASVPTERTPSEREMIVRYIAGGQWYLLQWWVAHEDEVSINELVGLFKQLYASMRSLL